MKYHYILIETFHSENVKWIKTVKINKDSERMNKDRCSVTVEEQDTFEEEDGKKWKAIQKIFQLKKCRSGLYKINK